MARTPLEEASSALEAGDWVGAKRSFESALALEETPEALLGLGDAHWWLGQLRESVALQQRAYAAFRHRGDLADAAQVALWLVLHYHSHFGNPAAARGWVARAARIIDDHDLEPLQGWLLLVRAVVDDDDAVSVKNAEEAHAIACRNDDRDLELCALSQHGAALIRQGRISEGVASLDEALAGSLGGEGSSLETVVFTSCEMITSCSQCADFERAVQWIRAADDFTARYGCPYLFSECRTFYGSILVATGDWVKAESELQQAIKLSLEAAPRLHRRALATLAELRLAQGRVEEAERLVAGADDDEAVAPVLARLHLLRDRPAAAAATVRRRLSIIGDNRLESGVLVELLGEIEIAQDMAEAAAERGQALAQAGENLGCEIMRARGRRLHGHALARRSDAAAGMHLDAALSAFVALGMPYEAARTRLLVAEACREIDQQVAVAEAQAALAAFEELGAGTDADEAAALLRRLGVKAARAGPREHGRNSNLTKREQEVLGLLGEGLSNPEIAARLYLSRKTVEHHVASVLAKLGVRSRAQAVAETTRRAVGK